MALHEVWPPAALVQDEWPLLIIVPASLRLVWAEELEKWLPHLRPSCIHVIEGKEHRVAQVGVRPCAVGLRLGWGNRRREDCVCLEGVAGSATSMALKAVAYCRCLPVCRALCRWCASQATR